MTAKSIKWFWFASPQTCYAPAGRLAGPYAYRTPMSEFYGLTVALLLAEIGS